MKKKLQTEAVSKSYSVHAEGMLNTKQDGIAEGSIVFPVRGLIRIRMERRDNDNVGERAKLFALTPTPSTADMVKSMPLDEPDFWWGMIPIEGYWFDVKGHPTKSGIKIQFIDTKQPLSVPVVEVQTAA